ncbi:MAG: aldo/keto reductase [Planctomycetales bacterium]|nr:aldo/keto reductase [Planctomycetales bacterium]
MTRRSTQLLIQRREFLQAAMATLACGGFGAQALALQQDSSTGIATRPLGRTGERVPIVGLGGYHIGVPDQQEAIGIMHEAIDNGMTFFDNAWDYHDGGSEEVMGKALATGGRRDKVFLMTKVCDRDYQGAKRHLEDSLRRLQTDRIDLWQFHEINWDIDSQWLFEQGGIKAALEAREQGKIRYIGFTGHRDPAHHLKLLAQDFHWDTVQMPINLLDAHYRSFQHDVLPVCREKNISVIGMKALGSGSYPQQLGISAETCRRYALSLPISTLVCGIKSKANLQQDLTMARSFKPITPTEINQLLADTQPQGSDGLLEPWKTTDYGSRHHREQHANS